MRIILLFVYTAIVTTVSAQDSIHYRMIFMGDAGEMNNRQSSVVNYAAAKILPGKTAALYLGDNIYPNGMVTGGSAEQRDQLILQSQYLPLRARGAPVYFIPGNHDWDRMGPAGLSKIKRQSEYLNGQGDSLLRMIPRDGCPDPIEINLTDSLTLIAFDSEWWLFPYDKTNLGAECECNTRDQIVMRLEQLFFKNRHKVILLASHHPFQTYGVHGGHFTIRDHIFPLTNASKNLYIPLPVIGSLYPLLRSAFTNPEDLKHPLYKYMIKRISAAGIPYPNLLQISGHEHGLQLIKNRQVQIVSGSGSKQASAGMGKGSLFADPEQGFVTIDLVKGNTLNIRFYTLTRDSIRQSFEYRLPYQQINPSEKTLPRVATGDSALVRIHPSYNNKSGFHKFFFGENYRKEWAAEVNLPVLRLSELKGGLIPLQEGGGMQSKSLRLAEPGGKEWVIRSVEKVPDGLLPAALQGSFARDWLDDVTSAQHPFSALSVPPLAEAVGVPHAKPVIGIMAPDKNLGIYERKFAGMVVLMEEREPLGKSDNTVKMIKQLQKDNDNSIDADGFLKARMLDMLTGDWDRHEDQWRWFLQEDGKRKTFRGVPRDRDQVFHLTEGLIPRIASRDYILPTLRDFDAGLTHVKWLLFKTRFVNAYPEFQFTREQWSQAALQFQRSISDSIIESSLRRLPEPVYQLRHKELYDKLTSRRDRLPAAMDNYYRFIQKIADIRVSDKNELLKISEDEKGGLNLTIYKISKSGKIEDQLMNKTYDKELSKELRIFLGAGKDSIVINNKSSPVKLKIIGGEGVKHYTVMDSRTRVHIYDKPGQIYEGMTTRIKKHISSDSAHTSFTPVNLYNIWMPMITGGINVDDGLIFGAGFKHIRQEGFRKYPYASMQQLTAAHSFSTNAYRIRYNGEWISILGKADMIMQAFAKAPNNTVNFFGRGNETVFEKTGDYLRFYRTRYGTYQVDPALRWRGKKGVSLSIGPSLYFYVFDEDDNKGRFINNVSEVGSYDSSTVAFNKLHVGVATQFISDKRNNKVLPQWGSFVNIRLQAYKGTGNYARDFVQLIPEVALYKPIGSRAGLVLAERMGGTLSMGNTAFYQSAFLGGQENLLGYRQYRFAGQHSFYNNLELRLKIADLASYILPGQFGLSGFWDIGRVWEKNESSGKWHSGIGGGIYFVPASIASFNLAMGYSSEGWYPYFTMGFRF